jgi:small-conductance mechanosensitive channel
MDDIANLGASVTERGISSSRELLQGSWSHLWAVGTDPLFEVNGTPVTIVGLIRIAFIIALAWFVSLGIRRGLRKIAKHRSLESRSAFYSIGRVAHYIILALGLIVGLSSVGIDFTKFALLASALGVGIGFGLQAMASNLVAGLIILFEKSLKVGDFVELNSGVTGEVKEINMRATLITTNDNVDILVPNSEFVAKDVTNWTLREAFRRIHIAFGVAYGSDKELVKKAALEAAENVKWTLKNVRGREPQVWLVNFGDSSLDFELVVWLVPEAVKRPAAVQAAYLWEIETKLGLCGIEIPFPQRDLHLKTLPQGDGGELFQAAPSTGKKAT